MKKQKISADDAWRLKVSKHLVTQVFKHSEINTKGRGQGMLELQLQHFLAAFIGSFVYSNLGQTFPVNLTEEEKLDMATKRFQIAKEEVQNAVAEGFRGAMYSFSGRDAEYYCQVKLMPPVANKEPC